MFDIGFWELVLIGLVLLLAVGPERLPKLARTAGLWVGRGRRMLSSVKAEIDREIKAEELKEILRKQAQSNPMETMLDEPTAKPVAGDSKTGSAKTHAGTSDKPESGPG